MTAAFYGTGTYTQFTGEVRINTRPNEMNWKDFYTDGQKHFGCEYLSPDVCSARGIKLKELKRRQKQAEEINNELAFFERHVRFSSSPPKTKTELMELRRQDAVAGVSPLFAWLVWQVVKILAAKVLNWAWDRYHEQQQELAAGKA